MSQNVNHCDKTSSYFCFPPKAFCSYFSSFCRECQRLGVIDARARLCQAVARENQTVLLRLQYRTIPTAPMPLNHAFSWADVSRPGKIICPPAAVRCLCRMYPLQIQPRNKRLLDHHAGYTSHDRQQTQDYTLRNWSVNYQPSTQLDLGLRVDSLSCTPGRFTQ